MRIPLLLQVNDVAGAVEGAEEVITEETISIAQLIVDGGWYIMGPLAILSILAVYIFVERFLAIRKASSGDENFTDKIRDFIHEGKLDSAKNLCTTVDSPIARMLEKGISRIGKPLGDISTAIENVGKLEVYRLEKSLSTLATIAGAAPMIGFLGTVIGMIVTFHQMKISGQGVEIDALSGGIMQAMVTTVAGLVIGIVAYMAYNILVAKVDAVIHKMEASTIDFLDLLQEPGK